MSKNKPQSWNSLISKSSSRLDEIDRLNEGIFGIIMVLTFTCTINTATAGEGEVQTILWGALGSTVAWGLIDAVMYLFSVSMSRGETFNTIHAVLHARSEKEANDALKDSLPEVVNTLFGEEQYSFLRAEIKKLPEPPAKTILTRGDYVASFKIFLTVCLSALPVAIPFIFFEDVYIAMRFSNAVAIVSLFIAGYIFGRRTRENPLISGIKFAAVGSALTLMTIALGG